MNEEQLIKARHKLSAGRIVACNKMPYYSRALMTIETFERVGMGTFGVDKHWRLYYDPVKCLEWSVDEIAAVWLHEVNHLIRKHNERFEALQGTHHDHTLFNKAADASINSDLREQGVILPNPEIRVYVESKLSPKWNKKMTAEQMYWTAFTGKPSQNSKKTSPDSSPTPSLGEEEDYEKEEDYEEDESQSTNTSSSDEILDRAENEESEEESVSEDSDIDDDGIEEIQLPSQDSDNEVGTEDTESEADDHSVAVEETDGGTSDEPSEDGEPNKESDSSESTTSSKDSEGDSDGESDGASVEESEGENPGDSSTEGDPSDSLSEGASDGVGSGLGEEGTDGAAEFSDTDESDCGSSAGGAPRDYEEPTEKGAVDQSTAEWVIHKTAEDIIDYEESNPGSVPGDALREAKQIIEPEVDWMEEFRSLFRRTLANLSGYYDYTYTRPSRRGSTTNVIMPSLRAPAPPELAAVLDTSGSMDEGLEIAAALGELEELVARFGHGSQGRGMHIVNCDVKATSVLVKDLRNFQVVGGGGTDMRVGIQHAAELKPKMNIILIVTDGGTPWPSKKPVENLNAHYVVLLLSRSRGNSRKGIPSWMQVIEVKMSGRRRPL